MSATPPTKVSGSPVVALPQTMQVLRYHKMGTLDELQLETMPVPSPESLQPGTALVKIHASGVNMSDVVGIEGWLPFVTVPRIPGRDYGGTVVAVGSSTDSEWVGKRIWATGGNVGLTSDGAWAEYKVSPIATLSAAPSHLSDLEAASAGLSWLCADLAVGSKIASVSAQDEVVVIGGSGAIGSATVQLCRALGARRVYGTYQTAASIPAEKKEQEGQSQFTPIDLSTLDSSDVQDAQLKPDGASRPAPPGGKLSRHLRTLGARPSVVIDAYGSEALLNDLMDVLQFRARIVIMAANTKDGLGLLNLRKLYAKGLIVNGVSSGMTDEFGGAKLLDSLRPRFEANELHHSSTKRLVPVPFNDRKAVLEALRGVKERKGSKPVIVMPDCQL